MADKKGDLKKLEEKAKPILQRALKGTSRLSLETVAGIILLESFGILLGIAIGLMM